MAVKWKIVAAIAIAAIALIVVAAYVYAMSSPLKISSEEARQLIRRGYVVLDVRTDPEWALGHYSDAIHIPAGQLIEQAPKLISKSARIVVYCNTGQRARRAAEQLERMGYADVRYITGGYWTLGSGSGSGSDPSI